MIFEGICTFASFQSQNYRAGKQALLCKLAFHLVAMPSSGLNNTSLNPSEFGVCLEQLPIVVGLLIK